MVQTGSGKSFDRRSKQQDTTLYMPSMYDSDDCSVDSRDEGEMNVADKGTRDVRDSRYDLQRCLAWSQDDDDDFVQDDSHDFHQEDDDKGDREDDRMLLQSFCSFHSAIVDSQSCSDQIACVKSVHWDQKVDNLPISNLREMNE